MPSTESTDPYEKKLAYFMNAMKAAKNGNGLSKLTEDHIKVLESIPEWSWDGRDTKKHKKALDLKDWVTTYGRYPSSISKDTYERSLRSFIRNIKMAKFGKGSLKLTDDLIEILESIPNWKWETKKQPIDIKFESLNEWVIKNGKMPNKRSLDQIEKKFGYFVSNSASYNLSDANKNILENLKNEFS